MDKAAGYAGARGSQLGRVPTNGGKEGPTTVFARARARSSACVCTLGAVEARM